MQGVKIHATVRRTLLYKFQSELKKGSVYSLQFLTVAANVGSYRTCKHEHKLIFQISSKVQIMEIGRVSGDGYDLVPIHEIFGGGYDMDYLVGKLVFFFKKNLVSYFIFHCVEYNLLSDLFDLF